MDKDILLKIHKSYRWVVAICDKDLIGKVLSEEEKQLDLSGNFFKGEEVDEKKAKTEIIRALREDATFNVVGERSVKLFLDLGLAKKEELLQIEGVPFILLLL